MKETCLPKDHKVRYSLIAQEVVAADNLVYVSDCEGGQIYKCQVCGVLVKCEWPDDDY